jgi:hypothetical protein
MDKNEIDNIRSIIKLGKSHVENCEYRQAIDFFTEALSMVDQKFGDEKGWDVMMIQDVRMIYSDLARCYFELEELALAVSSSNKALKLSERLLKKVKSKCKK